MKYSKNYSKLLKRRYTTIRRHSKGKIGEIVYETYPNGNHNAEIINLKRKPLLKIKTALLLKDTDCKTRKEAITLINSFYETPINYFKDKLFIYYLRRV